MNTTDMKSAAALIVSPSEGRTYDMGRMRATFVADGDETQNRFSISEWWLDANTQGPGPHAHDDDHIFYVIGGTLRLFVNERWAEVAKGSYVFIPGGMEHDFENHGDEAAGFVCINAPSGFETMMPNLVTWFADNPLTDANA